MVMRPLAIAAKAADLTSFTDASGRRFFTRKDGSNFDQMETMD